MTETQTQKAPAPVEQAFYLLIECSTAFRIAARNLKTLECYNASRRDTEDGGAL